MKRRYMLTCAECDAPFLCVCWLLSSCRGESAWTGDWSSTSSKWCQATRHLCSYYEFTNGEDDGVFWMSFDDFVVNFQRIYVCRVFDAIIEYTPAGIPQEGTRAQANARLHAHSSASDGGTMMKPPSIVSMLAEPALQPTAWCRVQHSSRWSISAGTACGHVCHVTKQPHLTPERNPQYALRLVGTRPAIVFLTLTQPTQLTGGGGAGYLFLSLLVLRKHGLRARSVKRSEFVAGNTKCRNSREICAELTLEPDTAYTIFVSTYRHGEESAFKLAAYSRHAVALQAIDTSVAFS
jgi:hypothetical protein